MEMEGTRKEEGESEGLLPMVVEQEGRRDRALVARRTDSALAALPVLLLPIDRACSIGPDGES